MPRNPSGRAASLAARTTELAVAVPQVVAHRMTRMAIAGPVPSSRDRQEFTRMVAEKNTAFVASWQAMAAQAIVAQQAFAATLVRMLWTSPWRVQPPFAVLAQVHDAALGVIGKGLAPVHRKAVANAKRLAKTRLR